MKPSAQINEAQCTVRYLWPEIETIYRVDQELLFPELRGQIALDDESEIAMPKKSLSVCISVHRRWRILAYCPWFAAFQLKSRKLVTLKDEARLGSIALLQVRLNWHGFQPPLYRFSPIPLR